jgi:dihydrofolate reductase
MALRAFESHPMRRIVVMMSISLDGLIEGPNRELDWHLVDDELHNDFNRQLGAMSVFLNGRIMFELMAEFWPTADQDPASTAPMIEYARIWRDTPKMVYSKTLTRADWNTTIVRDVLPADIERLKAEPGGDMSLGGADVAAAFQRHDLIDAYRLYMHPIVLGRGKPLFPRSDARIDFRLADTRPFGNGVVMLHYERARERR